MRKFKKFTFEHIYQISTLMKKGFLNSNIAKHIGVDRRKTSRELRRKALDN